MGHNDSPKELGRGSEIVVDLLLKALEGLEFEPRLISHGRIRELRGGVSCFELEAGKSVDAAILRTQTFTPERLFKVDYAVRGNIRGVLPRRIISKMILRLGGLLRKRIIELKWEIPLRAQAQRDFWFGIEGLPPGPGEVWEGGPHQKLTETLNQDTDLIGPLKGFIERRKGAFLLLSINSDKWGESIRISGNLWLKPRELLDTYASPTYLGIVNQISRHIKDVRRVFGGIAF